MTNTSLMNSAVDERFSPVNLKIAGGFLSIYIAWLILFVGIRSDHLYFISFLVVAFFSTTVTRKFILTFVSFWLFWIFYDAMRVFPNFEFNTIHVIEPYLFEKSVFGISVEDQILTPNEYLVANSRTFLDFVSGIFYLTWVPLPMAYCLYLYFTDKRMAIEFSAAFLFANLIGFVIYYLYPAAPPWYVAFHGETVNFDIMGNAAQLLRFDGIIGYPLFENMYTKNANVFAAIPSLHSAYPVVLAYYAWKKRYKLFTLIALIDVIGIWFAAVYSMHHYIIDVILGAFCAIFAIFVFDFVLMKTKFKTFIDRYARFIG